MEKTNLKFIIENTGSNLDLVACECVRCGNHICVFCLKTLPKHADGFGYLCPACNKCTIFELAGHHGISQLRREAEELYGK